MIDCIFYCKNKLEIWPHYRWTFPIESAYGKENSMRFRGIIRLGCWVTQINERKTFEPIKID